MGKIKVEQNFLIFNEYKKRMWYTANEICDDALDAENAVHDALFAIFQTPDRIESNNILGCVLAETIKAAIAIAQKTKGGKAKKAALKKAAEFNFSSVPEESEIKYEFSRRFLEDFEDAANPKKRKKANNKHILKKALITVAVLAVVATISINKYMSYRKTVAYPEYNVFVKLTSLVYGSDVNKITDPAVYSLTYIPEGFVEDSYEKKDNGSSETMYKIPGTDSCIDFDQYCKAGSPTLSLTITDPDDLNTTVNGIFIGYQTHPDRNSVGWEDKYYVYSITTSPDVDIEFIMQNVGALAVRENTE